MDHKTFASRVKGVLKTKNDGQAEAAVTDLRALLDDLALAVKEGVNDWHQQQALSLLVDALDTSSAEAECRAAWLELIQFTERSCNYWQEALSSARADFERWEREHG